MNNQEYLKRANELAVRGLEDLAEMLERAIVRAEPVNPTVAFPPIVNLVRTIKDIIVTEAL